MKSTRMNAGRLVAVLGIGLGTVIGCSRQDAEDIKLATNPSEAASQLDAAFASASDEFRRAAGEASSALRSGDLSRAVESLGALRESGNVSLQQGVAVHGSMVLLEARLIAASDAGDPKAREAYAQLRRLKQK